MDRISLTLSAITQVKSVTGGIKMSLLALSLSERRALKKKIKATTAVKVLKRAQAFVWLSEDMSIRDISQRLALSRQTLYDWVSS